MPMSPEFLPEFFLLLAGVGLGGYALHLLSRRRWRLGLALGALGLACIAIAFVSGKSEHRGWKPRGQKGQSFWVKQPLVPPPTPGRAEPDSSPFSLLLGEVSLRVVPSDHYVLSVNDEPFLTLDSLRSGLYVSCTIAGPPNVPIPIPNVIARISQNSLVEMGTGVRAERPDAHTLRVSRGREEILSVRCIDRRTVQVRGRLYVPGDPRPSMISLMEGVQWQGAFVPPGIVDLTPQGPGRIDFTSSGMIRIVPEAEKRYSKLHPGKHMPAVDR